MFIAIVPGTIPLNNSFFVRTSFVLISVILVQDPHANNFLVKCLHSCS